MANDTVIDLDSIDFSSLDDAVQESTELPIPEGRYLAVITGVKPVIGEAKRSFGYTWTLRVNKDNSDLTAWETSAGTLKITTYTFLGYLTPDNRLYYKPTKDGKPGKPGFKVVNTLAALGIKTGSFKPEDVIGRVVQVVLGSEPDYRETSQGVAVEDATKVLSVVAINKFFEDGVLAPRLPGYERFEDVEIPEDAGSGLKSRDDVDDDLKAFFGDDTEDATSQF